MGACRELFVPVAILATAQTGCLLKYLSLPQMLGLTGNLNLGTGKPGDTSQGKVIFPE